MQIGEPLQILQSAPYLIMPLEMYCRAYCLTSLIFVKLNSIGPLVFCVSLKLLKLLQGIQRQHCMIIHSHAGIQVDSTGLACKAFRQLDHWSLPCLLRDEAARVSIFQPANLQNAKLP